MRIIVNGQQAFGQAVLDALVERGEDVVGVYTAPAKEGARPDPLKCRALELGLPIFQPKSFRRPQVWEQMRDLGADLGVMAYVTLFVPQGALDAPRLGTIQYHPSLLPMHKGPSSINWPIIFGEKRTGLTIFWPDEGLDTGPVLLRKPVPIHPDDTLGSVYFERLFPLGVEAMLEAVDLVASGRAPKVPQADLLDDDTRAAMRRVREKRTDGRAPEALGTYEGWCRADCAGIDWRDATDNVYNLIRGCDPQPGAWTTHGATRLQLFNCRVSRPPATGRGRDDGEGGAGGQGGEVIACDGETFSVGTADGGAIKVGRVRPQGGAKTPAGAFAAAHLRAGDLLGAAPADR